MLNSVWTSSSPERDTSCTSWIYSCPVRKRLFHWRRLMFNEKHIRRLKKQNVKSWRAVTCQRSNPSWLRLRMLCNTDTFSIVEPSSSSFFLYSISIGNPLLDVLELQRRWHFEKNNCKVRNFNPASYFWVTLKGCNLNRSIEKGHKMTRNYSTKENYRKYKTVGS